MEKLARLLNVKAAPPRSVRPCTPEAVVFSWPGVAQPPSAVDAVFVAFDPNSLCAVQVDEATAERMAPGVTAVQSAFCNPQSAIPDGFTGLLFSGMAPDFASVAQADPSSVSSVPSPAVKPPAAAYCGASVVKNSPALRKLVLNLTHACNLRCKYCFAADYVHCPSMPLETAFEALGLFDHHGGPQSATENNNGSRFCNNKEGRPPWSSVPSVVKPPLSVAFFGGEPLLAWPTLILTAERVHQLAYERKLPYHLHVTTNGTLIDPLKAAALKRFNFSVLLSLDGPKEIHNASRPTAADVAVQSAVRNPQSAITPPTSFDLVMAGLDSLNAAGIVPMVRATFSDLPAGLVERLEFFEVLYRQGRISGASIEPAILAEGCSSVPQEPMDLEKLEAEWHEAAAWFVAQVKAGKPFPFFYFRKLLGRLLNCEFHGSECGAGRGYLTVGPEGNIFACHRESGTEIGRLCDPSDPSDRSAPSFNSSARAPWLRNGIAEHPECQSCWARYLCGGGCPQNRVEVGGGLFAPVPHVCAARKAMMKQIFWIAAQLTRDEALAAAGLRAIEKGGER